MEDSILVGHRDIPEIVNALLEDEDDGYRSQDFVWTVLGVELCSDIKAVRKMKHDLDKGQITTREALSQILQDWVNGYAEKGSGAPLEEFLEVIISNHFSEWEWAYVIMKLLAKLSRPVVIEDEELKPEDKDDSTATASIINSAQEKALYNTLILEKIYKNLQFEDRKNFKLVNQDWGELGQKLWRQSSRIRISKHVRGEDYVTMQEFVELCKPKTGVDSSNNDKPLELLVCPYHSYSINMYPTLRESEEMHRSSINQEMVFWKTCGLLIENLDLSIPADDSQEAPNILRKLLLSLCPNLKQLEIDCCYYSWRDFESTIGKIEEEFPMAEKLEALTLYEDRNAALSAKLLPICPNLKSLLVQTGSQIEGLLQPAINGQFIKLETLVIYDGDEDEEEWDENELNGEEPLRGYRSYQLLRSYVEKFPDTLKHLTIDGVYYADIRSNPSHLHAALAKCGPNLQSLELEFIGFNDESYWFMDLSLISFPNLTKFKFQHRNRRYRTALSRFDFGTLTGMPKLKELDVNVGYRYQANSPRSPGTEDWIYVAPESESQLAPAADSKNKLIISPSLKSFCFYGWEINAEDVKLFSQWFPDLTSLDATLSTESIPFLLESWERLDKLQVRSKGFVSLSKLRPLKETNPSLKILAHLLEEDGLESGQCIEVKELNGHVYYDAYSRE